MPKLKLAQLKGQPEIFHTIQGEGVSIGMPAVFIRSSLCNLHCVWCDTEYTWNWKNTPWKHENDSLEGYQKYDKSEYIVEPETRDIADQILGYNCTRLVITGGEPLLQQAAWKELITILKEEKPEFTFEVETNGSIQPEESFAQCIDQFNVSPKLDNSGNSSRLRINKKALTYFANHPQAWFKFVVAEESDLIEIRNIIDLLPISNERIILMPEGRTQSALTQRRLWLVEACKQHGFRFGDRLHIHLWGSKRGV